MDWSAFEPYPFSGITEQQGPQSLASVPLADVSFVDPDIWQSLLSHERSLDSDDKTLLWIRLVGHTLRAKDDGLTNVLLAGLRRDPDDRSAVVLMGEFMHIHFVRFVKGEKGKLPIATGSLDASPLYSAERANETGDLTHAPTSTLSPSSTVDKDVLERDLCRCRFTARIRCEDWNKQNHSAAELSLIGGGQRYDGIARCHIITYSGGLGLEKKEKATYMKNVRALSRAIGRDYLFCDGGLLVDKNAHDPANRLITCPLLHSLFDRLQMCLWPIADRPHEYRVYMTPLAQRLCAGVPIRDVVSFVERGNNAARPDYRLFQLQALATGILNLSAGAEPVDMPYDDDDSFDDAVGISDDEMSIDDDSWESRAIANPAFFRLPVSAHDLAQKLSSYAGTTLSPKYIEIAPEGEEGTAQL